MAAAHMDEARAVLGEDVLGPAEVARVFGAAAPGHETPLPFTVQELRAAREYGEMLVYRVATIGENPLTIAAMIARFGDLFDPKFLRTVGYQLKDEWGIMLEPLAATETCAGGWWLVRKSVLEDSLNLPYEEQSAAVSCYAAQLGMASNLVRRRAAVEVVYDTVLCFGARQRRLLHRSWDWSSSRTIDGGLLNVGGFTERGMQILAYSTAVRHGGLGVCPTRGPR